MDHTTGVLVKHNSLGTINNLNLNASGTYQVMRKFWSDKIILQLVWDGKWNKDLVKPETWHYKLPRFSLLLYSCFCLTWGNMAKLSTWTWQRYEIKFVMNTKFKNCSYVS